MLKYQYNSLINNNVMLGNIHLKSSSEKLNAIL